MTITAANWPEPLPEPSPPPGYGTAGRVGVTAQHVDPGHLMTASEWARVREDAAELERLEREATDDAT